MRKNIILSVVKAKQGSYEYRYTNFEVIGLARLEIKLEFTVPEVDTFTTWPSELLKLQRWTLLLVLFSVIK